MLALGTFLHALMWMPYQYQLAHGWTSLTLKINTLAVIALMLFSAVGALAQTEHQHDTQKPSPSTGVQSKKPMQHDMSKMDMSKMMNEPHHVLAMAYMQNMGTFAKALRDQAQASSPRWRQPAPTRMSASSC